MYCRRKMKAFQINRVQGIQREILHCSREVQRLVRQKQHGAVRAY